MIESVLDQISMSNIFPIVNETKNLVNLFQATIPETSPTEKERILFAIKTGRFQLKDATVEQQNDKEIVIAAIKKDFRAFEFASPDLKNDVDVILAAEKSYYWSNFDRQPWEKPKFISLKYA